MKTQKKKNIIAKGGCLIATFLLHVYSLELIHVSMFIPISLGVITLVAGLIFMNEIRKYVEQDRTDDKFYLDHVISHESEKWIGHYTELLNTQKASYTAIKKNTEYQKAQFEAVLLRLETLEKKQESTLQMVLELQKKALEGQKKALNIEINHSKENVNKIIKILQEDSKQDISSQFEKLFSLEENNQRLFQDQLQKLVEINEHLDIVENMISQAPAHQKVFLEDYYKEEPLSAKDDELLSLDSMIDGFNQELSYEGAASEEELEDYLFHTESIEDENKENASEADRIYEEPELEADKLFDKFLSEQLMNDTNLNDTSINDIVSNDIISNEIVLNEVITNEEVSNHLVSNDVSPQIDSEELALKEKNPEQIVVPLYEDPNKALTADEIAKLFASFGQ